MATGELRLDIDYGLKIGRFTFTIRLMRPILFCRRIWLESDNRVECRLRAMSERTMPPMPSEPRCPTTPFDDRDCPFLRRMRAHHDRATTTSVTVTIPRGHAQWRRGAQLRSCVRTTRPYAALWRERSIPVPTPERLAACLRRSMPRTVAASRQRAQTFREPGPRDLNSPGGVTAGWTYLRESPPSR